MILNCQLIPRLLSLAVLATTLAISAPARAETVYFTPREVLAKFFPKSAQVNYVRVTPTSQQHASIRRRLGYALPQKTYTFFVAHTGAHVDGYAFIDSELGQHLPITFAVKLTVRGAVARTEIMVYREMRGDDVRDARFLRQFIGKSATDNVRLSHDVVAVSGATISSQSITRGIERAVVVFDECMQSAAGSTADMLSSRAR